MKKITLTIALILGMVFVSFGQSDSYGGGGLFGKGNLSGYADDRTGNDESMPLLPTYGTSDGDQDAPLGSGVAVLLGLGGAYLVAKKRREE